MSVHVASSLLPYLTLSKKPQPVFLATTVFDCYVQIHLKLQLPSQPTGITLHDSKIAAHECYFFAQNILFVVKHKLWLAKTRY